MSAPAVQDAESMVAARNALTLGTSLAVTGSLALLVRLLIPRVLGPEAFGEYRLAESAAELLFIILTFGVDAQLRLQAALDPAHARGYLFGLAALRVAAGGVGIAILGGLLRATGANGTVVVLFLLIATSQLLVVLNNTYAAFEHAAGDVRWIARANLVTKTIWAIALGTILALSPAGIAIALAALAIEALRFTWLTGRGVRRHQLTIRPDVRLALTAVVASLPFFVNVVAHSLYARIGTGWLAALSNQGELGMYGAATNLASIALLGMPLLSWVLVPSAARAASRSPEEMAGLISSALRISLLVTVPVALAFHVAAEFWLRLFFGPAYEPAAPVLRILAPTFALAYASTVCAISIIQQGRIWTVAAISLSGVVVTMLLDMMLIPWGIGHLGPVGGAQGAAWATLGTEVVVTAALVWAARPSLRRLALGRTVLALGGGVAASMGVGMTAHSGVLVMCLAAAAFAVTVLVAGGIDRADLRFCRRVLGRPRAMPRVPVAASLLLLALVGMPASTAASTPGGVPASSLVSGYVIGPDDVLEIAYWREKELSAEVVVRPDGRIALPLIGDIEAVGLTPVELTDRITTAAKELLEFPILTVSVKQINSRKVVITGEVARPGRYSLIGPTSVIELIAMAGGLSEFADQKNVGVVRTVNGAPVTLKVNYKKIAKLQDLRENIALLPGDIVVVP